jgi:hypothetical protein
LKFSEYADLKSKSDPIFNNYPQFQEVLDEMKKLECKNLCTEGGCKEDCKIRPCVKEKNYDGCWECSEYKSCEFLQPLNEIHSIDRNLAMIKKYGPENWASHRGKHYSWL